jgi:hypothetical protein
MLVIFYHMLKEKTAYLDLGAYFLDRFEPERLTRCYVSRLEQLGHTVTSKPLSVPDRNFRSRLC